MNTFNEFELNRIKKFYQDELASRLQRSKSTRLSGQQAAIDNLEDFSDDANSPIVMRRPNQERNNQNHKFDQQRASLSRPDSGPFVDLNRYQHAFLFKSAGALAASGSGFYQKSARSGRRLIRFGRALFDFQAKNEREISLRRGDLVELLELIDHSWARVEDCQSGLHGLVPLNYIDYSVGCAVAKRDVNSAAAAASSSSSSAPLKGQLLPMSKGEPITLLRRLRGHWYEASNTRQAMGLVWSNDLEIIKQPVLGDHQPSSSSLRSTGLARTGGGGIAGDAGRPSSGFSDDEFTDDDDDDDSKRDWDWSTRRQVRSGDLGGTADFDNDGEDEMFIVADGQQQRIALARKRARSHSGTLRGPTSSSSAKCCQATNQGQQVTAEGPDLLNEQAGGYCERYHSCNRANTISAAHLYALATGANCQCCPHQMPAATNLPRRSSSSPYISNMTTNSQQQQQLVAELPKKEGQARLYRARYPYKPRQKDELELVPGDVLMVVHQCDDGWFIGTSYSTKEMGTFPGNFVELIS